MDLLRMIIVALRACQEVDGGFNVVFCKDRVNQPRGRFVLRSFLICIVTPTTEDTPSTGDAEYTGPSLSNNPPTQAQADKGRGCSPNR